MAPDEVIDGSATKQGEDHPNGRGCERVRRGVGGRERREVGFVGFRDRFGLGLKLLEFALDRGEVNAERNSILLDEATGEDAARELGVVASLNGLQHAGPDLGSLGELLEVETLPYPFPAEGLADGVHILNIAS